MDRVLLSRLLALALAHGPIRGRAYAAELIALLQADFSL